ncbi:MAG: M28 family peptidase [Gammaproteobacteria bacterium]|nr:M28 family peptidase [Gammaproteobacteria bacterium]
MTVTAEPSKRKRTHPVKLDSKNDEVRAWQRTARLETHVRALAETIGERNVYHPQGLADAAEYIGRQWQVMGYEVVKQAYELQGVLCSNLEITRPGNRHPEEILLIGAHYDSVIGSPGANDNGSGVAALLEMARKFANVEIDRTVRFVAFVNEEPPFFLSDQMGSMMYAKAARDRCDNIQLMVSLETIGHYSDRPGSQRYPPLFGHFYPDKGNFVAFVSNLRSRRMLRRFGAAFRQHSQFPAEQLATFSWIPGVGWSDHQSFWRYGYQALMVTDTAFYRYPHYHAPTDKADELDFVAMAVVTEGIERAVMSLATKH